MKAEAYRIVSSDGEHVETCRPDLVDLALKMWNDRRELDYNGDPIGEYVAEPCKAPKAWGA